jgi:biopolymer transport protein ExbD
VRLRDLRRRLSAEGAGASSDIAFLLIIYFIVIAGFNINEGFLLSLPARDSVRAVQPEDLLIFRLDAAGALYRGEEALSLSEAEALIAAAGERLAMSLTVDPLCPWQPVVSFVEIARRLDVEAFSFNMTQEAGM